MRIYIAGPMEGRPQRNIKAFRMLVQELEAMDALPRTGFDVDEERKQGEHYTSDIANVLIADLREIEKCDAVLLMHDWHESGGARTEHQFAARIGKPVFRQVTEKDTATSAVPYNSEAEAIHTSETRLGMVINHHRSSLGLHSFDEIIPHLVAGKSVSRRSMDWEFRMPLTVGKYNEQNQDPMKCSMGLTIEDIQARDWYLVEPNGTGNEE